MKLCVPQPTASLAAKSRHVYQFKLLAH